MPNNFRTWGEARRYCEKYELEVKLSTDVFTLAETLLRAYQDGYRDGREINKKERTKQREVPKCMTCKK